MVDSFDKINNLIDEVIKELEVQKLAMINATLTSGWSYKFNNPKARRGKYYPKVQK